MLKLLITIASIYIVFLLFLVAAAQETPTTPIPSPEAQHDIQHYTSWKTTCEGDNGPYTCWVYIVSRRQKTECSQADIDGDGYVGVNDFSILSKNFGCREKEE